MIQKKKKKKKKKKQREECFFDDDASKERSTTTTPQTWRTSFIDDAQRCVIQSSARHKRFLTVEHETFSLFSLFSLFSRFFLLSCFWHFFLSLLFLSACSRFVRFSHSGSFLLPFDNQFGVFKQKLKRMPPPLSLHEQLSLR